MKKIIKSFIALCFFICAALIFTSCLDDEELRLEEVPLNATVENEAGTYTFDESMARQKHDWTGTESVTVMCYMNGSDLESEYSEATTDIKEMLAAPYNEDLNIIIQTMGTKKWSRDLGIRSDRSQRFRVMEDELQLIDDSLGQLDCTRSSVLSDFISWTAANYPADRYILMFWDHGGGPVYGFGYDEWQSAEDAMTIDEIQLALGTAGVDFDFIGMDCCIMSCMEVCCALYDHADYMILSEDFESGLGWAYEGWLTQLSSDPATPTPSLAKIAIDDMVDANDSDWTNGSSSILSLVDESMMKVLFRSWQDFAYANQSTLLGSDYSRPVKRATGGRYLNRMSRHKAGDPDSQKGLLDFFFEDSSDDTTMADYYITDIMSVAQNIDSEESRALSSALGATIVYTRSTSDDAHLTGLSVTIPYGDQDFYKMLSQIFMNCGFDESYIAWLGQFVDAQGSGSYYDYDDWDDDWDGWDDWDDDYDWEDWDYWDDDDYWTSDGYGWDDWDFSDFWDDDWEEYDDYDYDEYGDDEYYDSYWSSFWDSFLSDDWDEDWDW